MSLLVAMLVVVGVIAIAAMLLTRSQGMQRYIHRPMEMPPQPMYGPQFDNDYGPRYERPGYGPMYPQQQGYYPPQQQGYYPQQQGYYPQRQGMNPWVAGGAGALGGAVLGYGLGQAMNDNEGMFQNGELVAPEQVHGDYMPVDAGDFGAGADFGGDGGEF